MLSTVHTGSSSMQYVVGTLLTTAAYPPAYLLPTTYYLPAATQVVCIVCSTEIEILKYLTMYQVPTYKAAGTHAYFHTH